MPDLFYVSVMNFVGLKGTCSQVALASGRPIPFDVRLSLEYMDHGPDSSWVLFSRQRMTDMGHLLTASHFN